MKKSKRFRWSVCVGKGWSICVGNRWSLCSETGGQFKLEMGGQFHRFFQKDSWGLNSEKNGEYSFYLIGTDGEFIPVKRKGRYMEIEISMVDKILL